MAEKAVCVEVGDWAGLVERDSVLVLFGEAVSMVVVAGIVLVEVVVSVGVPAVVDSVSAEGAAILGALVVQSVWVAERLPVRWCLGELAVVEQNLVVALAVAERIPVVELSGKTLGVGSSVARCLEELAVLVQYLVVEVFAVKS